MKKYIFLALLLSFKFFSKSNEPIIIESGQKTASVNIKPGEFKIIFKELSPRAPSIIRFAQQYGENIRIPAELIYKFEFERKDDVFKSKDKEDNLKKGTLLSETSLKKFFPFIQEIPGKTLYQYRVFKFEAPTNGNGEMIFKKIYTSKKTTENADNDIEDKKDKLEEEDFIINISITGIPSEKSDSQSMLVPSINL
jgi:hypothetical protein